jgi:SRSO17 transposase
MVEPRRSAPTAKFVDEYCQLYQNLFPEVRSFEAFKYLPEISKIVGLDNHQGLHHFLTESPWDVKEYSSRNAVILKYFFY